MRDATENGPPADLIPGDQIVVTEGKTICVRVNVEAKELTFCFKCVEFI